MAFVLLLVVSLGTFIEVEIRSAQARTSNETARQYALLALEVARGELQKYVGVDQRATASAGILDYDPEDEDGAGLPAESRWIGVWDSQESNLLTGVDHEARRDSVNDKALTWLVSGNQSSTGSLNYTPRSFVAASDRSTVIAELGAMNEINFSSNLEGVNVPLVDITGANGRVLARYAYWIDEENTKGRIDYIDSDRSARLPEERQSYPTKGGIEGLLLNGSDGAPFVDDERDGYDVNGGFYEKMLSLETLSWLETGATSESSDLDFVTPHLTSVSMGVMANSKDGGLKKDLSFGLSEAASEPVSTEEMFPAQGLAADFYDPGGPLWGQLRDYVSMRSNMTGTALSVVPYSIDGAGGGISPVMNRFQFFVYATFYDKGVASDVASGVTGRNLGVRLFFMPAIVLYNPYNVPLAARDYYLRFHTNAGHYIRTTVEAPDVGWVPGDAVSYRASLSVEGIYKTLNYLVKGGEIAPGQSLVYSPESMEATDGGTGNNHLVEGFVPGMGFFTSVGAGDNGAGTALTVFVPDDHLESDGDRWAFKEEVADYYSIGFDASTNIFEGGIFLNTDRFGSSNTINSLQRAQGVGLLGLQSLGADPYSNIEIRKSDSDEANDEIALNPFDNTDFPAFGWTHSPAYPSLSHWSPELGDTLKDTRKPIWTTFNVLGPVSQENADSANMHTTYDRITAAVNTLFPGNYKARPGTTDIYADAYSLPLGIGAEAFVGYSDTSGAGGYDRLTLVELPENVSDYSSIAELSSIPLRIPYSSDTSGQINQAEQPLYAIGNSYAPATMLSTEAAHESNWGGGNMVHYDYSYLLNEALWDDYFFSGYDPDDSEVRPYFAATSDAAQYGYSGSSAHLMLEGAFNVNSVSVPAWAHLLSVYFGEELNSTTGGALAMDDKSLFSRFKTPLKSLLYDLSANDELSAEAVGGARALTRKQIHNLAEEIVEVVKSRGPFLSLADFVNRSIDSSLPDAFRASGPLQSAIDGAEVEGTSKLNKGFDTTLTEMQLYPNPEAMALPAAAGLPGFLMQSDLLSRVGQFLVTRSDTYVIHFYAEALDPITGEVSSSSRGQAVVQRRPGWVDEVDQPGDTPTPLSVNDRFGRRFEVTQIDWIQ